VRPRIQESAAREEDEHPYELLLTAETKKPTSVDGRAKGTAHLTLPQQKQLQKEFKSLCSWMETDDDVAVMFLVLGHLGFKAAWPLQSFIFPV
jgi:hypothetical protein